jgi:UTP:GlnB (protein PII) uridylyltransferase
MPGLETPAEFERTMPASYRELFSSAEIEQHARIVAERGERSAHVALVRTLPNGLAILCLVADDRPGLMLLVSAAFVANGLDVRSAQVYSRRHPDGRAEAVDFFWVRAPSGSTLSDPKYVARCAHTVADFVSGYAEPAANSELPPESTDATRARVTIEPCPGQSNHWLISIEARDSKRLLLTIALTLHRHALEIVHSELRTEGTFARDRFEVACASAGDLDATRIEKVRVALLSALAALEQAHVDSEDSG